MEEETQDGPSLEDLAKALTPKERAFAEAFVGEARSNATEAAAKAGYQGTKRSTLAVTGCQLLRKPNVRAYIDAILLARSASQAQVLAELTDVGLADFKHFLRIKYGRDGEIVEAKLDPKAKVNALEILAKCHGMLTEKKQITTDGEVVVVYYPEGV
jgi:phage terminase small subunit